jgi:hypothetical protein
VLRGWIILKWIVRDVKWNGMGWPRLAEYRTEIERHNELPLCSTLWEVLECVHNYQLLKKGSAP